MDYGFIENKGQWDEQARFYTGSANLDLWVTNNSIRYDFYTQTKPVWSENHKWIKDSGKRTGQVIELEFLGANQFPVTRGVAQRDGVVNFIRGEGTFSDVGMYNEAMVANLYSGVNMRVYRDNGRPRFDLIVAPGTDPSTIKFRYNGTDKVLLGRNGEILVPTRFGQVSVTDLYAYQPSVDGHDKIQCEFVVNADNTISFKVGDYDANRPLVIDPIVYATLFGGPASGAGPGDDFALGVTVDHLNQAYATGTTNCPIFPTTNGAYDNQVAGRDAFVTKFRNDASNLIYSTFVGGNGSNDQGLGISVDNSLRVLVTGLTNSPSTSPAAKFPTTPGAPQESYGGDPGDAFLFRLNAAGSALEFSTYLGGTPNPNVLFPQPDVGLNCGFDANGNMYVAGQGANFDFPTTAGVLQQTFGGGTVDGFVTRISPNGVLDYSTFIGGSGSDTVNDMVVDQLGFCHITGPTNSPNFVTTPGAFDRSVQQSDAFVAKVDPSGSSFQYSTVLGGSGQESANAIALDAQGNTYIAGASSSVDFPRTSGAFDNVFSPDTEGFVTKLAVDGASLVYSTFMNGIGSQQDIAVDDLGVAHIVGRTNGNGTIAIGTTTDDDSYNGPNDPLRIGDAYVQALNDAGSEMIYGSYLGGEEDEFGAAIHIDSSRNAYIVGYSNSWTEGTKVAFPSTPGVFKPTMSNDNPLGTPPLAFFDCFLMKLKVRPAPLVQSFTIAPGAVAGTETAQATVTLNSPPSPGGAVIRIQSSNENVAFATDANGNPIDDILIPDDAPAPFQANFEIRTNDVVQTFVVTFTVELEGDIKTQSITVAPWLTNLSISPNSIVGGNRSTGRVTLFRPAPAGGMTLAVTTSDSTKAYAIGANGNPTNAVNIPAGQTTATFDIQTRGVDAAANVTVLTRIFTPSLQVTRSQIMQILPARIKNVTFFPTRINGGEQSRGTVELDGEIGPTAAKYNLTLGSGTAPITLSTNPPTSNPTFVLIRRNTSDPTDIAFGTKATFIATAGTVSDNSFRNIIATRQTAPFDTKQGTLFVDANSIVAVNLDSASVLGGTALKGHVTLAQPAAPGGFTVNIASNNPTYAPLNVATVTVPAGAIRSTDFVISTKLTRVQQTARITASKPGYTSKFSDLTIRPINLTFTVSQNQVVGGSSNITGTLTLNEPAPTSGVLVQLSSSNPAALTVPNSVFIPSGTASRTFPITSSSVAASQNVTITASVDTLPTGNVPPPIVRTQTITVTAITVSVSVTPTQLLGGVQYGDGVVTLSQNAGGSGLTVSLTSSNTNAASVSSSVTVPAGQRTATFKVITFAVTNDVSVQIGATLSSGGTGATTIQVLSPRIQSVTLATGSVIGGDSTTGQVVISARAPSGGIAVQMQSSNAGVVQVPPTVVVPEGQRVGSFTVNTTPVSTNTSVTITARYPTSVAKTTTLQVLAPNLVSLTLNPSNVIGGNNVIGTVRIDRPAPAGGLTVQLAKDPNATGSPFVNLPATATIPAGATQGTFTIGTSTVSRVVATQITASFGAASSVSATLTIRPE